MKCTFCVSLRRDAQPRQGNLEEGSVLLIPEMKSVSPLFTSTVNCIVDSEAYL